MCIQQNNVNREHKEFQSFLYNECIRLCLKFNLGYVPKLKYGFSRNKFCQSDFFRVNAWAVVLRIPESFRYSVEIKELFQVQWEDIPAYKNITRCPICAYRSSSFLCLLSKYLSSWRTGIVRTTELLHFSRTHITHTHGQFHWSIQLTQSIFFISSAYKNVWPVTLCLNEKFRWLTCAV